jgi:maleate isomerase
MRTAADIYTGQTRFLGVVTPSGNTVVERITLGILADFPEVSAHFSRTPVFGASDPSPDAYALEPMMSAARLLAHVKPGLILWNGSKGAGIGFSHDVALAEAIQRETGIRATTSVLGLRQALDARGIRRIAVLSPYSDAGQQEAIACLEREGYACVAEQHRSPSDGYSDNLSYASAPLPRIAGMARAVAPFRPEAIVCLCTNFPAAAMAAPIEAELGIPVFDTTALGAWHALKLLNVDTSPAAARWGSLFLEGH